MDRAWPDFVAKFILVGGLVQTTVSVVGDGHTRRILRAHHVNDDGEDDDVDKKRIVTLSHLFPAMW